MTNEPIQTVFKIRPDGSVLFNPYFGGPTVVLTQEQHVSIRRMRAIEWMLSVPVGLAGFVVLALGWKGALSPLGTVAAVGIVSLVGTVVHRYFKAAYQAMVGRAPIAAEQLPRLPLRSVPGLFMRTLPEPMLVHGLLVFGAGFLGLGYDLVAIVFHLLPLARRQGQPALLIAALFVVCGSLLYAVWKERRRRKNLRRF